MLGKLLLACVLLWPFTAARAEARIPVFLSADVGNEIDDQWPLLHLLLSDRFDVRGIGSAHAPPENIPAPAAENSRKLIRHILDHRLKLRSPPPLLTGSNHPLRDARSPVRSEAVKFLLKESRRYSAKRRLQVLVIGAATDVASSLLIDPSLADRIRIVAMGFRGASIGGAEFNVQNDPDAWRVILASRVPLVIGAGDVTSRDLGLTKVEAAQILAANGPLERWLLRDFSEWFDDVAANANIRRPNGPIIWPIWDHVVVAHLLGWTKSEVQPRPGLGKNLKFIPGNGGSLTWVTSIDRERLFADFRRLLRHRSNRFADPPCSTIGRAKNACWKL
jgi:inosine-uridine nucleoside N-ribohydrolase